MMNNSTLGSKDKPQTMKNRCRIRSLSIRSRLFIGFLVLLFLISFFLRLPYQHNSLLLPGNRYTVLINTWKRNDLLKKSVSHYASCNGVDAVRVVWSEEDPPSDSLLATLQSKSKNVDVKVDINYEDNLNNRFKPLNGVNTAGIFSVDDDVLVPCNTVEFAFSVWLSAPDTMVGFVPRMHWAYSQNEWRQISSTYRREQIYYNYGGWWSVWWTGTYSMVLTKAAFLHHKYLQYYTYDMPSAIRDYVARERNCEDIAMSFMVANLTKSSPIWVKGKLYEIGGSGISSLKGHNHRRTTCLNFLTSAYGYMPLVSSSVKAVDANLEWLW